MMGIVKTSIRHPVFAVMIIAALVGLGWISIGRLGVDLFPNVEFPYVSVLPFQLGFLHGLILSLHKPALSLTLHQYLLELAFQQCL